MKEENLRETIKALEEKLSQQEERYDRLKREYVACKARSRIDKNRISELEEESKYLSMDVPVEYVMKHNPKKQSYSLWLWKMDTPILIKTDRYSWDLRKKVEQHYKALIEALKEDILPF